MVLSSADFFFQIQFVIVFCLFFNFGNSVVCQAVWIQIMPVGPDPGPNCFKGYQQTTLVSKEFMTTNSSKES